MKKTTHFTLFTEKESFYTRTLKNELLSFEGMTSVDIKVEIVIGIDRLKSFLRKDLETTLMIEETSFNEEKFVFLNESSSVQSQIFVCTESYCLRLKKIKELFKPQGMWHIQDISPKSFPVFLNATLTAPPFMSPTILSLLDKANIKIEDVDLKLLHYLAEGIYSKDLVNVLPFSAPTMDLVHLLVD